MLMNSFTTSALQDTVLPLPIDTEPHTTISEKMVYQLREENQDVSLCFHADAYLNLKDFRDKKHFHKQPIFSPLFP